MSRRERLRLIETATALLALRPWQRVEPDAPFTLHVPGDDEPWSCVITGQAGDHMGLNLLRGPNAERCMLSVLLGEAKEVTQEMDLIGVALTPWSQLDDFERRFLVEAGMSKRRDQLVPGIFVGRPGRRPRAPNATDTRILRKALAGLAQVLGSGEFDPPRFSPGLAWPAVIVEDAGKDLRARVEAGAAPRDSGTGQRPLQLPEHLSGAERVDATWIVGSVLLGGAAEDSDETMSVLLVAQEESGLVLGSSVTIGNALNDFLDLFAEIGEESGLPQRIRFDGERFATAFGPMFAAAGIDTGRGALPEDLRNGLREQIKAASNWSPDDPTDDDLDGWRRADEAFWDRFIDPLVANPSNWAVSRFFGNFELGEKWLEAYGALGVEDAFGEWCFAHYRGTARSKTPLAKARSAKGLSSAEQALLDARENAEVSFFDLIEEGPRGALELECVFTGERVLAHGPDVVTGQDRKLPLRLIKVGAHCLASPAGPALEPGMFEDYVERQRELGIEPSRAELTLNPGRLGNLYELLDQHLRAAVPLPFAAGAPVHNHDGDPCEEIVAEFPVRDFKPVRRALDRRPDLIRLDDTGLDWVRPVRADRPGGLLIQMGLLAEEPEQLVFEVNSMERLTRMAAFLESIPGVGSPEIHRLPLGLAPPAPDDEWIDPLVFQSEAPAAIARGYLDLCIARLDLPTERFGGQTSRGHAATPAGRAEVEAWIQSHPPLPGPSGPVHVDKQAWIRALDTE